MKMNFKIISGFKKFHDYCHPMAIELQFSIKGLRNCNETIQIYLGNKTTYPINATTYPRVKQLTLEIQQLTLELNNLPNKYNNLP